MGIEENLKQFILDRYRSIRAFTNEINVPYSTIDTMFKRGIGGTGISTISKICNALEIDALALAGGEIKKIEKHTHTDLTKDEYFHIKKYRNLDEYGKKAVNALVDVELERITSMQSEDDNIIQLFMSPRKASAGTGYFLFDDMPDETISVVYNNLTGKADICIPVDGNSMEPIYFDGDILLVRRQPDIDIGDIGIFTKGDQGYVKKKGPDRLISLNKAYPDIYPSEFEEILCFGKVLGKLEEKWVR